MQITKQMNPYFLPVIILQSRRQSHLNSLRPLFNGLCNGRCCTCTYISVVVACLLIRINLDSTKHKLTEEIQQAIKNFLWDVATMASQPSVLFIVIVLSNQMAVEPSDADRWISFIFWNVPESPASRNFEHIILGKECPEEGLQFLLQLLLPKPPHRDQWELKRLLYQDWVENEWYGWDL